MYPCPQCQVRQTPYPSLVCSACYAQPEPSSGKVPSPRSEPHDRHERHHAITQDAKTIASMLGIEAAIRFVELATSHSPIPYRTYRGAGVSPSSGMQCGGCRAEWPCNSGELTQILRDVVAGNYPDDIVRLPIKAVHTLQEGAACFLTTLSEFHKHGSDIPEPMARLSGELREALNTVEHITGYPCTKGETEATSSE